MSVEVDADAAAAGGCCGWFARRRQQSAQRKYQHSDEQTELTTTATTGAATHHQPRGTSAGRDAAASAATVPTATAEWAGAAEVEPIVPPLRPADDDHTDQAAPAARHATRAQGAQSVPGDDGAAAASMVQAATSAPVQAAAPAAPSPLCAQWARAVRLLREACQPNAGADDADLRSPILEAWIKEQGFTLVHSALLSLAAAEAEALIASPTSQPSCSPSESNGASLGRQGSSEQQLTQRTNRTVLNGTASGILLTSLGGGSPPATSRWTRRLEARTRREHEASVVAAAQQQLALTTRLIEQQAAQAQAQGGRAALDRTHSHELSRHSSFSRTHTGTLAPLEPLDEDEAAGTAGAGAGTGTGAATYRRHSSKRPLAMPAESPVGGSSSSASSASAMWSLPLDLSTAQELNQRQQMLQQLLHDSAVAAAAAQQASPFIGAAQLHPDLPLLPSSLQAGEARGLADLARGMGQQLVMSNLAELGAALSLHTQHVPAHAQDDPSSAAASQSLQLLAANEDEGEGVCLELEGAALVQPVDVAAWVGSLALLLRQFCPPSTPLEAVATGLQQLLLPPIPTDACLKLIRLSDASEAPALRGHLLRLMELTAPLLAHYSSTSPAREGQGEGEGVLSGCKYKYHNHNNSGSACPILPPREWISSQCAGGCAAVLVPSVPVADLHSSPSARALDKLEQEVRAAVQGLCYPAGSGELSLSRAITALRRIAAALRWLLQAQRCSADNVEERAGLQALVLRLHPFLLHSLLDLFWSRLCVDEGAEGFGDGQAARGVARQAWMAWGSCVRAILASVHALFQDASAAARAASTEAEIRASDDRLRAVHAALRDESTTALLPSETASGATVVVSVPPLVQLLTATVSLLFDAVALPPEAGAGGANDPDAASAELRSESQSEAESDSSDCVLHELQMCALRCIDSACRLVSTRGSLRAQHSAADDGGQGEGEGEDGVSPSAGLYSPLLGTAWFWDGVLALFAPSTGCLWEVVAAAGGLVPPAAAAGGGDSGEGEDDPEAAPELEVSECHPSLPMQELLCAFLAEMVFSPSSSSAADGVSVSVYAPTPPPCPWLLDGTFVAAYLQCHYAALLRYYHLPSASATATATAAAIGAASPDSAAIGAEWEALALAHLSVLRAASRIPCTITLRTHCDRTSPDVPRTYSPPPAEQAHPPQAHTLVVSLAHVHFQLYHLGLVGWLTSQISLEMDAGERGVRASKAHEEPLQVPMATTGADGGDTQPQLLEEQEEQAEDQGVDNEHKDRSDRGSRSRSDSGSDGSDFSDINFDDSEDDAYYPAPSAPPALFVAPKLAIVQGERHINEQFALGWDGQPLHPEPALFEPPPPPAAAAAEEEQQQHEAAEPSHAGLAAAATDAGAGEGDGGEDDGEYDSLSPSGSGSGSDLGEEGWGDSAESIHPSPRGPAGMNLAIPTLAAPAAAAAAAAALAGPECDEALTPPLQAQSFEQGDQQSPPVCGSALPSLVAASPGVAAGSYTSLRARHALYRSPLLHARLVELLLHLCLDPGGPAGAGLNGLYCQRFPLQASVEQQRLADAALAQRAAQEAAAASRGSASAAGDPSSSSASVSASMDDLVFGGAAPEGALVPLGVNVLFALNLHVNHPANAYLCPMLLRSLDDGNGDAAAQGLCQAQNQGQGQGGRDRGVKRLMKLLFEQLFDPALFQSRSQIGRGRFASVYAATYTYSTASAPAPSGPMQQRVALKQVEQPSSVHDQVFLVDLFTEISILDMLAESRAATASASAAGGAGAGAASGGVAHAGGARAPCVEVVDFGVGEGCFWIVMPLAECSLKAFKHRQAEAAAASGGAAAGAVLPPETLAQLQREHALIRSFLTDLVDPSTYRAVLPLLQSQGQALPSRARRILSSLALYHAMLQCCLQMQRRDVVHFDIKADNFLVLLEQGGDGVEGDAAAPCPVRVALADFGEALLVPSAHGSSLSLSHCGLGGGSNSSGSRISRGTENIQSPEMLTLIRALDRTDGGHDRRRKAAADFASDVWALGCAFYELVMHVYADGSTVGDAASPPGDEEAEGQGQEEGGMSGGGMLFEEAAGLPIFLQVTSERIPLLSDSKRAHLARAGALGGPLLASCDSFLAFVLRRDRRHRPGLGQVLARFRATALEMARVLLGPLVPEAAAAAAGWEARACPCVAAPSGLGRAGSVAPSWPPATRGALQPHPTAGLAAVPAPDMLVTMCTCKPSPACWAGLAPPFRCGPCAALQQDCGAVSPADLRALFARPTRGPTLGAPAIAAGTATIAMRRMVTVVADWQSLPLRVRVLSAAAATSALLLGPHASAGDAAACPVLLLYDEAVGVDRCILEHLTRRKVFFLPLPPSGVSAADGTPATQQSRLGAPLPMDATAAAAALHLTPELAQSARDLVRTNRSPVLIVAPVERASSLFALLVLLAQSPSGLSGAIEHHAALRDAAIALMVLGPQT